MRDLTSRDLKLLRTISAFGILHTRQIKELIFKDIRKTTMHRRLRILEKRKLVRRVGGYLDGSVAWSVPKKFAEEFGLPTISHHVNRNTLEHDTLLNDIRISLAKIGIGENWISDQELKQKAWKNRSEKENIPDAVFTVPNQSGILTAALELELRLKSRERYKKIFRAYRWTRSLGLIWYLVPSESIGTKLLVQWNEVTESTNDRRFRWSLVSEVLKDPRQATVHGCNGSKLLTDMLSL